MDPKQFKGFVWFFNTILLFIIICGILFFNAIFDVIMTAKKEVLSTLQLRQSEVIFIRNDATEKAIKKTTEDLNNAVNRAKFKYCLSSYIKLKNPALSADIIKDKINHTFTLCDELALDPCRVFAVEKIEADFVPNPPIGAAGEWASMQVTPGVFNDFRKTTGYSMNDMNDWRKVNRVGCLKLKELHNNYGEDWDQIIGQYNAGNKTGWKDRSRYHVEKYKKAYAEIIQLKSLMAITYEIK